MAVSGEWGSDAETPLLDDTVLVLGVTDYKGCPVLRSKSGAWRSAGFIVGKQPTHTNPIKIPTYNIV